MEKHLSDDEMKADVTLLEQLKLVLTEAKLKEQVANRIARSRCEVCNDCGASISTDNPDEVAVEIIATVLTYYQPIIEQAKKEGIIEGRRMEWEYTINWIIQSNKRTGGRH